MSRTVKTINVEVGARIKQARLALKLTRDQLAAKAGYSANFVNEVERGKCGLSSESIKAFSLALGVSADALLFGSESPQFNFFQRQLSTVPPEKLERVLSIINDVIECSK